jgi:hypothetical protein
MSFLAKFGQVMLKIVGIATGFEPLIAPLLPAKAQQPFSDSLTKIAQAVGTVETVVGAISGPGNGASKLKGAVPLVAQIIQTSELVAGRKIKDEAAFTAAVQGITSNVADLLNALEA